MIWNLWFFSFSDSWRTWRFILPRPGKRLRLRKGNRRKETGGRRQETVSRKLVWLFGILNFEFWILNLGFGIWVLEFYSFSGSWRTWRFILPRPGKRLRLRKGDRRRETGDSFAEIGLAIWDLKFWILNFEFEICDLEFGIWDLGFYSFSGSWRTWRFNLPRLGKIRLRTVIGHWSLVKRLNLKKLDIFI